MKRPTHSKPELKSQGGELFLVATPIGNLGDITLRALETLKSVDMVACEDTRTSGTLLNHYGIKAHKVACHSHNEAAASEALLEALREGKHVALISDAGTPLLSDPGARLVDAAIKADIKVTPIPGASALLSALTIAGLPSDRFCFVGFLPTKKSEREGLFAWAAELPTTLVFYEAPHRLLASLEILREALGDREAAVARELTKLYEECQRGNLVTLIAHFTAHPPKGECVILVAGAHKQAISDDAVDDALREALATHSLREVVDEVTKRTRRPRSDIYARALAIKNES